MSQKEEKRAIEIPAQTYRNLDDVISRTKFDSVEEYIIYVVNEVRLKMESEEDRLDSTSEEDLRKRLESLGYLN